MPRPPLLPRWAFLLMCGMWAVVVLIGGGAVAGFFAFTEPDQRPTFGQWLSALGQRLLP
jgi:hypothetical protein